jgi:hypothetical protein
MDFKVKGSVAQRQSGGFQSRARRRFESCLSRHIWTSAMQTPTRLRDAQPRPKSAQYFALIGRRSHSGC